MVDPMTSPSPLYRKGTIAICLLALIALMLLASGCTQQAPQQQQQVPASQQQTKTPAPVTATRTDSSHMTIAYPGSSDTSTLIELEATVTDSAGKTQTRSAGDHLSTTPLKFGATIPLTGTFNGNDHVLVTGYFLDGSHKLMLDTTI
jgi:outer membrane receptor protein involved in Fe transport